MIINSEYPQVFGHLIEILVDSNYSKIAVLLLQIMYEVCYLFHYSNQMVSYFSNQQEKDCQNVLLLANQISDLYVICNQKIKESKNSLVIRSITSILNHLSRFGESVIDILNKNKSICSFSLSS